MLRIQRRVNGRVRLILSGRIEAADIDELRRLIQLESAETQIALDLKDVTLVDREAIKFLIDCEADGVRLENCPPYVCKWIGQESGQPKRKKK